MTRASCACGGLQAEVDGLPRRTAICHCHDCRTRTGSAFSWNAWFDVGRVRVPDGSKSFERVGDEGSTITYHFCPDCGVTVWYTNSKIDGVAIPAGAFAPDTAVAPNISVYDERRPGWIGLPDDLERMN